MKTVVAFVMVSLMGLAACGPKAQTAPANAAPAPAPAPATSAGAPSVISVGEPGLL